MKVAHISVANTGGAGIAAYRIHKELSYNQNVNSSFICQQYRKQANSNEDNIYIVPKKKYSYKERFLARLGCGQDILNMRRLDIIDRCCCETANLPVSNYLIEELPAIQNADIINLHWVAGFLNYPTFFKKIKKPIVWTIHDMNPFSGIFHYEGDSIINKDIAGELDEKVRQEKLKFIKKSTNLYVVSPSEWLKKKSEISQILGGYSHFNIANGLDFSCYREINKMDARRRLGINNEYPTFLFIAHDIRDRRKGFDLLVSALIKIKRFDFNLISVGQGDIELNIPNHFNLKRIDDLQELNSIYSAADLTILPSREDNLPNVLLESFANGTPVMSFMNGGMSDYIIPGKTGVLIPEIDGDLLANSLMLFIKNDMKFNPSFIREYGQINFDIKKQSEKYYKLYSDILFK